MAEASPVSVDTVSPDAEGASPAPIRGLLNGEIVVASVRKVLRYNTGVLASGEYGVLYVTNFRIVFAGAEKTEVCPVGWVAVGEENRSIPLTSVAQLYSTLRGSSSSLFTKQRVPLSTQTKVSTMEGIEVVTKDCFVHRFGVQFVNGSDGSGPAVSRRGRRSNSKGTPLKKLIATLLRHAAPVTTANFFAFDYAPHHPSPAKDFDAEVARFKAKEHAMLDTEMLRCGLKSDGRWYIGQNLSFMICLSYPALVVVPVTVSDELMVTAGKMGWQDGRFPVWRWSCRTTGAWVARSFQRISNEPDVMEMMKVLEEFGEVVEIDATERCCTAAQAENAFGKLFDACCSKAPDESLDAGWMGTFNDTRWPQLLENALSVAAVGARAILAKRNVLVTGSTGNLTDAVVSSLIQVIVDPFRRTRRGFDELVRAEWVSFGFPLVDGTLSTAKRKGQHALFTLFLDAVHQIITQYPLRWEFTDSYLVHLWRSSFMGLHSTFLFNTEKERMTQKYFQCTPYWQEAAAASADQFWHPFTNVLFRPSDDPAIPDSAGPRITLWAHCFLPQSAGRQLQDDRAIRQQVHTKLIRIATALCESGGDLATSIAKLGLPPTLAAVVLEGTTL